MPRKTMLVNFTEIISHACTLGYSWNPVHDILHRDGICPMYECNSYDYYFSEFVTNDKDATSEYGHSDDTIRIMVSFFVEHNLSEFTVVND